MGKAALVVRSLGIYSLNLLRLDEHLEQRVLYPLNSNPDHTAVTQQI